MQTFQRHTTLKFEALEHRYILISTFIGIFFPNIRQQIQNGVAGLGSQPLKFITKTANSLKIACSKAG